MVLVYTRSVYTCCGLQLISGNLAIDLRVSSSFSCVLDSISLHGSRLKSVYDSFINNVWTIKRRTGSHHWTYNIMTLFVIFKLDYDECTSSPCLNGGTCVNGNRKFSCFCPRTHKGRTCEGWSNSIHCIFKWISWLEHIPHFRHNECAFKN